MPVKAHLITLTLMLAPLSLTQTAHAQAMPEQQLPQNQLPKDRLPESQLPQSSAPASPSTRTPLPPQAADIAPGTIVRGPDREVIGRVVNTGETQTGLKAVIVNVDGSRVALGLWTLKVSGTELQSPLTKSEVLAKAASPSDPLS